MAAAQGFAQMPPPSPPPPSRPLASVDPDDIATLSDAAARELQMKRENLKLAMMELDLAERREKIANQQAERALQIKERELELAERERALNPPPPPPPPPAPAPPPAPPQPDLRVSSEMGVSIPPSNAVVGKKKLVMSAVMDPTDPAPDPREQLPPYVRAPSVRDELRAENAPPEPAGAAPGAPPGGPPSVHGSQSGGDDADEASGFDSGRNQDINARLARMHSHKDYLKEEYLGKLDELDRQMAEAAIAQHKREVLASKVAEQAVRDAKMTRVTQLANLIAASLEMVKKSGDALDHVVLKLVDHLEQEAAEELADDDPARNPLDPPDEDNEDLQAVKKETLQQKLMSLMTTNPSTEQLEEAVGMIEGMKPKGEWDNMASLGENLASLQNFMREMDGKATEEEEALAIANAVLAAEGQEEKEEEEKEAAATAPGGSESGGGGGGSVKASSEVDPDDEEKEEVMPVPPELADKLKTLRGKKKYLEEIKDLELQVRKLQEQAAAGFPEEEEEAKEPELDEDGNPIEKKEEDEDEEKKEPV